MKAGKGRGRIQTGDLRSLHPLAVRFWDALDRDGVVESGEGVLVALSGGRDSAVLLHLLRFGPGAVRLPVTAAHFDHGMRPGSEADAHWVRGLCRAWSIPLRSGGVERPPTSEAEARKVRFEFLWGVLEEMGLPWLLTGHHGDDQVETVLFRIARGTGLPGLAGIPLHRSPGLYRPLLHFSRNELRSYAAATGVPHRDDPTNQDLSKPRNVLRHRILPEMEQGVSAGVRTSVQRLARLARENEEAWDAVLPQLLEGVMEDESPGLALNRDLLLTHPPALRARILREYLRRSGVVLNEAGTKALVEFTRTGASGGAMTLPGGIRFLREFHRFRIMPPSSESGSSEGPQETELESLTLNEPYPGSGTVTLGGVPYLVRWGPDDPGQEGFRIQVESQRLQLPLTVRGWKAGDRILLSYGSKKVKKVLAEARIPASERDTVPVVVDAEDRVLWVAGVVPSVLLDAPEGSRSFYIGIRNVAER